MGRKGEGCSLWNGEGGRGARVGEAEEPCPEPNQKAGKVTGMKECEREVTGS